MKIELLFFGRPSETLKVSHETVVIPDYVSNLGELLAWLGLRGEAWAQELTENRVRCAINQEFSGWNSKLKEHDEVALFSPISGG